MKVIGRQDLNLLEQRSFRSINQNLQKPAFLTHQLDFEHADVSNLPISEDIVSTEVVHPKFQVMKKSSEVKTTAETIQEIQSIQRNLIAKVMKILVYLKINELNQAIAKATSFWTPMNLNSVNEVNNFHKSQ